MSKYHCKYNEYGTCILLGNEKFGDKCIGYSNCDDYKEEEL